MNDDNELQKGPDIGAVQTDIGFANDYRLEVIKTVLGISTALLAFTISFRPKLIVVQFEWLMKWSWWALSISIITGIVTMYLWERFYISYRDHDWKGHRVFCGRAACQSRGRAHVFQLARARSGQLACDLRSHACVCR